MNIYRCGSFQHTIEGELPPLKNTVKAIVGKSIRRIDRFTQLALIGAFNCYKQQSLEGRTGLYLSSSKCSLENMTGILDELCIDKRLPSPFKFVNTVGNAANFHVSQQLDLNANSVYLAKSHFALASALSLAQLDLQKNRIDAALVGLVTEAAQPLDVCRELHGLSADDALYEASTWFLLGQNTNEPALAKCPAFAESISWKALCERTAEFIQRSERPVTLRFGPKVTREERKRLLDTLMIPHNETIDSEITGPNDQFSALVLKHFIESGNLGSENNPENEHSYLVINNDNSNDCGDNSGNAKENDACLWSYMAIQKD